MVRVIALCVLTLILFCAADAHGFVFGPGELQLPGCDIEGDQLVTPSDCEMLRNISQKCRDVKTDGTIDTSDCLRLQQVIESVNKHVIVPTPPVHAKARALILKDAAF